jgi:hypothetical protein
VNCFTECFHGCFDFAISGQCAGFVVKAEKKYLEVLGMTPQYVQGPQIMSRDRRKRYTGGYEDQFWLTIHRGNGAENSDRIAS